MHNFLRLTNPFGNVCVGEVHIVLKFFFPLFEFIYELINISSGSLDGVNLLSEATNLCKLDKWPISEQEDLCVATLLECRMLQCLVICLLGQATNFLMFDGILPCS